MTKENKTTTKKRLKKEKNTRNARNPRVRWKFDMKFGRFAKQISYVICNLKGDLLCKNHFYKVCGRSVWKQPAQADPL